MLCFLWIFVYNALWFLGHRFLISNIVLPCCTFYACLNILSCRFLVCCFVNTCVHFSCCSLDTHISYCLVVLLYIYIINIYICIFFIKYSFDCLCMFSLFLVCRAGVVGGTARYRGAVLQLCLYVYHRL